MAGMSSIERVRNTLDYKPVDHVAAMVSPWISTGKKWMQQGHLAEGEDVLDHFDCDIRLAFEWRFEGSMSSVADPDFKPVTIEEDEDTILTQDGNGARLRQHKKHESTPEHVGFTVTNRATWEERIKPFLVKLDRRRIDPAAHRKTTEAAHEKGRYVCGLGIAPFEQMQRVCGHEHMLLGMAEDPDWVKDMVMTYARFAIMHLETLFAEGGDPDGMFLCEDMGFKDKPFLSPAMYREIMLPGHKLLFDFIHSRGLKVILHSCGFIEPLVPGLVEAGIDCLQVMEVKAGMDMIRLARQFGGRISFYGNIDARLLIANDRVALEREMREKIPAVLRAGSGYILSSDHSEPPEVEYETEKFFIEKGREISRKVFASMRPDRP